MPVATTSRALLSTLLVLVPVTGAPAPERRAPCAGRYADALSAMRADARAREARPAAEWVFCLRATAVYEQISYGRGGRVRRQYHRKVRHGTGFATRKDGARWLVVTNVHVADFPEVTGDGAELEGVPPGSRKVKEEIRIVASEAEPDAPEQVLLSVVVADPARDVVVLASSRPLPLMPYRLGRSSELRVGNAVLARGFPLGAFAAVNGGKVIAVAQRDRDRGWDHEDFAVDALLNLGSSGSPVFAVACATGEPELVGVYHAGYRGAQGLNVVVAVDELRVLLEQLRAPPPAQAASAEPPVDPRVLLAALAEPLVFPFGGRAVRAERSGDALRFAVLDAAWPLSARVDATLVDPLRGAATTGGLRALRDSLRAQLALVIAYRSAEAAGGGARATAEGIAARVREREEEQQDLLAAVDAGLPGPPELSLGTESAPAGRATDGEGMSRVDRVELIRERR